jgi:hypothetical protein
MALAKAAAPGDPLSECWLARERLRVSEGRSMNTINTTSKTLATGGGDMFCYLSKLRAMKEFAARAGFTLVKLPATKGPRQSINVQLPTAILKNLPQTWPTWTASAWRAAS